MTDSEWMALALDQARLGAEAGEVPVGAVVVRNGQLVASAHNLPLALKDPCAHAEVLALRQAGQALDNYRLDQCEVFVTLEPCAMCAQAMLHARVKRVVFGAPEPKMGAAGSVLNLFGMSALNHQTQLVGGVRSAEAAGLMRVFFDQRREFARVHAVPLVDYALRTPEADFSALWSRWPSAAFWIGKDRFIASLPALAGLNLHYMDTGTIASKKAWVALHSADSWWPQWAAWARLQGEQARVLLPDLVGFGQSDKPKKEGWHHLDLHAQILTQWLQALDLSAVHLVVPADQLELGQRVLRANPGLVDSIEVVEPQAPSDLPEGWRAVPYPDRGHQAALRAWRGQ